MPAWLTGTEREEEIKRKLAISLRRDLASITALPADRAQKYRDEIADFRIRAERWLSGEPGLIYPDRPAWFAAPKGKPKPAGRKARSSSN